MRQSSTALRTLAGAVALIGVACGSYDRSSGLIDMGGRNTNVRINELMPRNSLTFQDEYGGYDDWIELYNPGNKEVSLSGCFLSDDEDTPYKAQLGHAAVVPAEGFLVVWADNEPEQGDLHVGFRLSGDGEGVLLTAPDGTSVDSVSFGLAPSDRSYARYPDGVDIDDGGSWAWCDEPTPGALNGESYGETGGGNTGGTGTGGAATGGAATGGANTAGASSGDASTAGANTAGASDGGADTAGANTAGASTGGANTGGASTGGASGGGAN